MTFRRAVAAQAAQAGAVTKDMIKQAEWIAGLELTEDERASTARSIQQSLRFVCRAAQGRRGIRRLACLDVFPGAAAAGGGRRRNQATAVETPIVAGPNLRRSWLSCRSSSFGA